MIQRLLVWICCSSWVFGVSGQEAPPPFVEASTQSRFQSSDFHTRLELGQRERELMLILLEGCFEDNDVKVSSFDRFLNRVSEMPKGELFDLLQTRWKSDAGTAETAFHRWIEPELRSSEWVRELGGLLDQLTEGQLNYQSVRSFGRSLDQEIQKIRLSFGRDQKIAAMGRFEDLFEKAIGEINEIIRRVVDSGSIAVADPAYDNLFRIVIVEYFSRLSFAKKKQILADLLALPPQSAFPERLAVLFQNAGPQFQKMMQALARDPSVGTEFSEILVRLESNVKTVPFEDVHRQLLKNLAPDYPRALSTLSRQPLGSGTMAQIHLATLVGQSKPVVIRFLKPDSARSLQEDNRILNQIVPMIESHPLSRGTELERFGPFVHSFFEAAQKEMNAEVTGQNQIQAERLYPRWLSAGPDRSLKVEVKVPKLLNSDWAKRGVLVQELAPGVSMSRFFEFDPKSRQFVAEALAGLWVEEVVFRSGFFHADLHQGNVKVSRGPDNALVVTLLDFGMTGQLSLDERAAFLKLAAALEFRSPRDLRGALRTLLQKPIPEEGLERLLGLLAKPNPVNVPMFMKELVREGAELPPSFVAFSRGNWLVTQMLKWSGSRLSVEDLALKALKRGLLREAPARLGHLLIGHLSYRASFLPLTNAEILQMGVQKIRSDCASSLSKLLKLRVISLPTKAL